MIYIGRSTKRFVFSSWTYVFKNIYFNSFFGTTTDILYIYIYIIYYIYIYIYIYICIVQKYIFIYTIYTHRYIHMLISACIRKLLKFKCRIFFFC